MTPRRSRPGRVLSWGVSLCVLGVLLVTALRLAGVRDGIWPIPSTLAFTPYVLALALGGAAVAFGLRRRAATAVLVVCAILIAAVVAPREVPVDQPAAAAANGFEVRVTAANILHGHVDPAALAEIVRRRHPDVLSLEELAPPTTRRLGRAGVFTTLPHRITRSGATWNDTGIFSVWPVRKVETGLPTVYLTGAITPPGRAAFPFVSAHPTPPVEPSWQARWVRWLRSLPGPRSGALQGGIIAGDFNATLDHAELRSILDLGWRDAARERGDALTPTWQGLGGTLRLTLDHILVPPGAAVTEYHVDDLAGSDHDAISATIKLPAAPSP